MQFYPSELKFAQDSIANYFRDGRTLQESFKSLLNCDNPELVLPTMDAMFHEGKYFVTDGNRRLYLLKLLQREGLVNGKVRVNLTSFNEMKYTTDNGGTSVRVRGRGNMEQMLKNILRQHGSKKRNIKSPNRNVYPEHRNTYNMNDQPSIYGPKNDYITPPARNMYPNLDFKPKPVTINSRPSSANSRASPVSSRASSANSIKLPTPSNRFNAGSSFAGSHVPYPSGQMTTSQAFNPPRYAGVTSPNARMAPIRPAASTFNSPSSVNMYGTTFSQPSNSVATPPVEVHSACNYVRQKPVHTREEKKACCGCTIL